MSLRVGTRVHVPWGLESDRDGTIVEVWGDPKKPSHVRVELDPIPPDDDRPVLLLSPSILRPLASA